MVFGSILTSIAIAIALHATNINLKEFIILEIYSIFNTIVVTIIIFDILKVEQHNLLALFIFAGSILTDRECPSFWAVISGPVPLPTRRSIYTVLRSPFIDKKSREQFETRIHKRLIDIYDSNPQTVDSLMKLDLPAGVDIEIQV